MRRRTEPSVRLAGPPRAPTGPPAWEGGGAGLGLGGVSETVPAVTSCQVPMLPRPSSRAQPASRAQLGPCCRSSATTPLAGSAAYLLPVGRLLRGLQEAGVVRLHVRHQGPPKVAAKGVTQHDLGTGGEREHRPGSGVGSGRPVMVCPALPCPACRPPNHTPLCQVLPHPFIHSGPLSGDSSSSIPCGRLAWGRT